MTDFFLDNTFIVAGCKPWNRRVFDEKISRSPGRWIFVSEREKLTVELLDEVKPRYVFFLHWSWLVPNEIIDQYECVCFHMADVPYGRGGSPLQNLIIRGHSHTKLTALRMTHGFDEGPVYLKEELCLDGNAEEIYIRATYLSAQIINRIISEELHPIPQSGDVVIFNRRNSAQSMISELGSLTELHDFIRMLDAEGYPKAFLDYGGFRYEFSRAALYDGRIVADVKISRPKDHLL